MPPPTYKVQLILLLLLVMTAFTSDCLVVMELYLLQSVQPCENAKAKDEFWCMIELSFSVKQEGVERRQEMPLFA